MAHCLLKACTKYIVHGFERQAIRPNCWYSGTALEKIIERPVVVAQSVSLHNAPLRARESVRAVTYHFKSFYSNVDVE